MDAGTEGKFDELIGLAAELRRLGRREPCLADDLETDAGRLDARAAILGDVSSANQRR